MDVEQALSALGVSAVPDAQSLRRAYLRKVRAHSPERDPEGFGRVRDAYDFLRHRTWLWEPSAPMASDVQGAPPPPAADPPLANEPSGPELVLERSPSWEPRDTARQEDAPARHELFEKWIEVHDAQALDDPERTARVMIELFDARLLDSETPLPAPEATFAVILALVERDSSRTAAELLSAFEARSRRDGVSPYAFSPATAARHKLIRELIALRGLAPRRLTRLLARMIREERPLLPSDAEEAALLVGPGFREAFAARAPTLFAAAQPVLFKPSPKSAARQGLTRVGWWVMFAVVLHVLRMVPNCTSTARSPELDSAKTRSSGDRDRAPAPSGTLGPSHEALHP